MVGEGLLMSGRWEARGVGKEGAQGGWARGVAKRVGKGVGKGVDKGAREREEHGHTGSC